MARYVEPQMRYTEVKHSRILNAVRSGGSTASGGAATAAAVASFIGSIVADAAAWPVDPFESSSMVPPVVACVSRTMLCPRNDPRTTRSSLTAVEQTIVRETHATRLRRLQPQGALLARHAPAVAAQ